METDFQGLGWAVITRTRKQQQGKLIEDENDFYHDGEGEQEPTLLTSEELFSNVVLRVS